MPNAPNPGPRGRHTALRSPTVFWVAVVACTVVIRPDLMPNLSFTTWEVSTRKSNGSLGLWHIRHVFWGNDTSQGLGWRLRL